MKRHASRLLVLVTALAILATGFMPVQAASPPLSQTVHVVRWGDNLDTLALRYGTTVSAIMQANGLKDPNFIWVGQTLKIPGGTYTPPASTGGTYTVQWGDSLSGIAARFGVSMQALMSANGLSNSNYIYAGQVLRIPGAAAPAPQPPASKSYHTVRTGDTLTAIAYRYGTTVEAIMQANNLRNASFIWIGQVLTIPGAYIAPSQPAASYYTVRVGDTLTSIAIRYGTTVWAIMQANNIYNASFIYIGQRLVIPGKVTTKPVTQPVTKPVTQPPVVPPYTQPPIVPCPPGGCPPTTVPAGAWIGRVIRSDCTDQDTGGHQAVIRVAVIGLKGLPVRVTSGSYETTGLTGTKSEYGEFAVEFAPYRYGIYTVTPQGLGTSVQVRLDGRCTAWIEFVRR